MSFQSFPKVELHLHHEGAAPAAFIRQLAHEKRIDLSGIFEEDGRYKYENFTHFLSVYEAACTVLKSPEDFHRLTLEILENCAQNGAIYVESFLSPDFCGGSDVVAWREYLSAIQEASATAQAKFGITARGIVTCIRHFGPDLAKASAKCAAETAGDFIVGFGMGGDESQGKQGDFSYAFDMAREAKLRLTTHAGEWGGAESVRQAIFDLKVERLGHGVQVIEDPKLIQEVIARQITLEVCPGSNVFLGVAPSLKEHPIKALYDQGVRVSISTDDPPFFQTTLTKEYNDLAETFGWDEDTFKAINLDAIDAAFCDETTKADLRTKLEEI